MPNRDDIAMLMAQQEMMAPPRQPFSGQTTWQFAEQNLPQIPRYGSIDWFSNPEYFNEISRAQGNSPGVTVGPGTPFDTPMTSGGPPGPAQPQQLPGFPPPPPGGYPPPDPLPYQGSGPYPAGPPKDGGQMIGGMDPQEWLRLYRGG